MFEMFEIGQNIKRCDVTKLKCLKLTHFFRLRSFEIDAFFSVSDLFKLTYFFPFQIFLNLTHFFRFRSLRRLESQRSDFVDSVLRRKG